MVERLCSSGVYSPGVALPEEHTYPGLTTLKCDFIILRLLTLTLYMAFDPHTRTGYDFAARERYSVVPFFGFGPRSTY